ncbi:MAG: hypothetical protein AAF388_19105, partial [Bacteroidota bacterium]
LGSPETLKEAFVLPFWDRRGIPTSYDVDHKLERQLGGGNSMDNYWLLESSANRSSGSLINNEINRQIKGVIDGAKKAKHPLPSEKPSWYRRKGNGYKLTIEQKTALKRKVKGRPNIYWTKEQVEAGDPLKGLKVLNKREIKKEGLSGDANPTHILILPAPFGGNIRRIRYLGKEHIKGLDERIGNYRINEVYFTPGGDNNRVVGRAFKSRRSKGKKLPAIEDSQLPIKLLDSNTVQYGGVIDRSAVLSTVKEMGGFQIRGMSPVEVTNLTFDPNRGLVGGGRLLPSVPFLNELDINLVIDEEGVRFEKTFSGGEINVPAPFSISDVSLTVAAGTDGLKANGDVQFGIDKVGEGEIEGFVGSDGNFGVKGSFNFDSQLFNPASIEIAYENGQFTAGGTIGIPKGKLKGIKQATVSVAYGGGNLTANGTAILDVPGIKEGSFHINYTEKQFSIGGSFQLRDDIPGIRSGSVSAEVAKVEGDEGYQVKASGTAVPDIPGIESSLSIEYDNGALMIQGEVAFERGLLSGKVKVGATNRALDDEGQPTGKAGSKFIVFGGGELTLRITPWLEATAGVEFLPDGQIIVKGRIGLPSSVNVFDRKGIDKNLFSIPQIEIPIFAIPLGPKSIGIVATINGGLDFTAGFGPGQIQELFGEVTYNPDKPEETSVNAGGKFVIPADAGLTLRADLGLGLSAGIASVSGGIEIAGSLGLAGEASAGINMEWSPTSGLEIHARGDIEVRPKFTFDINLIARASLNLPWPLDLSKSWRHNLYSFSWGPDIVFGIGFPIDYIEGQPFDMSFDDIEVRYPELDIGEVAVGLGKVIKSRVF